MMTDGSRHLSFYNCMVFTILNPKNDG